MFESKNSDRKRDFSANNQTIQPNSVNNGIFMCNNDISFVGMSEFCDSVVIE